MKFDIRNITIVTSFTLGWLITIAGFLVPPLGVVDNSVLFILGQALSYTAVGVGLKDYVDIQFNRYRYANTEHKGGHDTQTGEANKENTKG